MAQLNCAFTLADLLHAVRSRALDVLLLLQTESAKEFDRGHTGADGGSDIDGLLPPWERSVRRSRLLKIGLEHVSIRHHIRFCSALSGSDQPLIRLDRAKNGAAYTNFTRKRPSQADTGLELGMCRDSIIHCFGNLAERIGLL